MTSPTDNEIIEGVQKAIWEVNNHAHIEGKDYARAEAEAAFAFLEPLITKRAREAVLRELWEKYKTSGLCLESTLRLYALAHDITLDGDGNG